MSGESVTSERDRFYHTCWLTLKSECPELIIPMTEIELSIAGFAVSSSRIALTKKTEQVTNDDNRESDDEPIINVL